MTHICDGPARGLRLIQGAGSSSCRPPTRPGWQPRSTRQVQAFKAGGWPRSGGAIWGCTADQVIDLTPGAGSATSLCFSDCRELAGVQLAAAPAPARAAAVPCQPRVHGGRCTPPRGHRWLRPQAHAHLGGTMAFFHVGGSSSQPTFFEVYAADKLSPSLKAAVTYSLAVSGLPPHGRRHAAPPCAPPPARLTASGRWCCRSWASGAPGRVGCWSGTMSCWPSARCCGTGTACTAMAAHWLRACMV